jgi:hypothetical protein
MQLGEQDITVKHETAAGLLESERNLFLTGITLFLLLCASQLCSCLRCVLSNFCRANHRFISMIIRLDEYEKRIADLRERTDITEENR